MVLSSTTLLPRACGRILAINRNLEPLNRAALFGAALFRFKLLRKRFSVFFLVESIHIGNIMIIFAHEIQTTYYI